MLFEVLSNQNFLKNLVNSKTQHNTLYLCNSFKSHLRADTLSRQRECLGLAELMCGVDEGCDI